MKENKYDDEEFFEKYSQMDRSKEGLKAAGEWYQLKKMLPDFKNKSVLDLGCGFGWHCQYSVENGASKVIGVDISEKMLEKAKEITDSKINYLNISIEDIKFPEESFNIVVSSLAFHYLESFENICQKIYKILKSNGNFVFSVEHPIFTAKGNQDWFYDSKGEILHWPVDNYYNESIRKSTFLGEEIFKYHKTLTTYINTLLKTGFEILEVEEAKPTQEMLENNSEMKNELRRPMMLLISARKK